MTDPQPKPPREVKHELHILPGAESVLRLVAVAPTELHLKLQKSRLSGRTCTLSLRGTHKYLPADTVCNVLLSTTSEHADPREYSVPGVPMQFQGDTCTVQVDVDVFEAGLFGRGQAQLTVVPDFPLAEGCVLEKPFEFNHPLHIQGLDLSRSQVLFGEFLELEPVRDSLFENAKLMLSVFASPALKPEARPEMAPETARLLTFDWARDDKALHWRIGCAQVEGSLMLGGLLSYEESCVYDLRLEVFQETPEEVQRYLVWEKPRAFEFKRPTLTAFELRDSSIHIEVADIAPDFALPMEVSLWQWTTSAEGDDRTTLPVMYPLGEPLLIEAPSSSFSWKLLFADDVKREHLFALLRVPPQLSGTDAYLPLSRVFNYDAQTFKLFDDEQLWLEPVKKSAKGQTQPPTPKELQALEKTQKALATALASTELKHRPLRIPDFDRIAVGVRDDKLCLSLKLLGEPSYWRTAEPVLTVHGRVADPSHEWRSDPRGPASYQEEVPLRELMKLTPTASAGNPRLLEALLPLTDKRLLDQKVEIRAEVTHPGALHWGERVITPRALSVEYEAHPHFGTPSTSVIELTDDTTHLGLRCPVWHMPNGGKEAAVLGFRLYEQYTEPPEPVLLTGLHLRYELPKDKGGLCDAHGVLKARVVNERQAQRLGGEGCYLLEVVVLNNAGKVLTRAVPAARVRFGGEPRTLSGKLIYQDHPRVTSAFKAKVIGICKELEIEPNFLMACMAFETMETFRPDIKNIGGSEAYGLIQFTRIAAESLKMKLEDIRAMTALRQLDCVQLYMANCIRDKGPLRTLSDVYMAILCPAAVGQPESYVCYRKPSPAYEQNKGLDTDPKDPKKKKGEITKQDATAKVTALYDQARGA